MIFGFDATEPILALAIVMNVVLAFLVYKNNPRSATNIVFMMLSLITSLWLFVMYVSQQSEFFKWSLITTRLTVFLAVPQSILFFFLAKTLPQKSLPIGKKTFYAIVASAPLIMLFTLSPLVFSDVKIIAGQPQQFVAPGMGVFALYVGFFSVAALHALVKKRRRASGEIKKQMNVVMTGVLLMLGLIIGTIMIPTMLFQIDFFVRFAPLYALIFLGMTAYAIVKHRLLDIRFLAARAVAFAIIMTLFASLYFIALFLLVEKFFNFRLDIVALFTSLALTLVGIFTFQPFFKWVSRLTMNLFFKYHYDSGKLLANLTRIMAENIDLEYMAKTILDVLLKKMGIMKGAFLIVDGKKITDIFVVGYDPKVLEASELDQLFAKKYTLQNEFIFEDLKESHLKKIFRTLGVMMAIPIKVDKHDIALMILGQKLSGDIYNKQDGNVLEIFASQAGIAIQNAKSYQEIKKFSREMEKRVEERTLQLKKAHEGELVKARDLAKLKDEFVFVAAHELRAPVTAIRGFLELVSESESSFPKDVRENLDYMSEASDHLNHLINNLLEIARSEAGATKIEVEPLAIKEVLETIVNELGPLAKPKNNTVTLTVAPNIGNVLADEQKIKEVLMNLVTNAFKYNKEGGVVDVNVFPVDDEIMIEVRDNGHGIPQEQQEKIFQKFFRAYSDATRDVIGTGLGLFITRMLVEKMGGRIMFSSVEGEGSTFAILLKRAAKAAKAKAAKATKPAKPAPKQVLQPKPV